MKRFFSTLIAALAIVCLSMSFFAGASSSCAECAASDTSTPASEIDETIVAADGLLEIAFRLDAPSGSARHEAYFLLPDFHQEPLPIDRPPES